MQKLFLTLFILLFSKLVSGYDLIGVCGCWPLAQVDCCLCEGSCVEDPWKPPNCVQYNREVMHFDKDGSPCVKSDKIFDIFPGDRCSYFPNNTVCEIVDPGNSGGSGGSSSGSGGFLPIPDGERLPVKPKKPKQQKTSCDHLNLNISAYLANDVYNVKIPEYSSSKGGYPTEDLNALNLISGCWLYHFHSFSTEIYTEDGFENVLYNSLHIYAYTPRDYGSPPQGYYVVAKGTEMTSFHDLMNDGFLYFKGIPPFYSKSINFLEDYFTLNPNIKNNVTAVIGHSLGAVISELIGLTFNFRVFSFDSPGSAIFANKLGLMNNVGNIEIYNSLPNMVNTLNPQIKSVNAVVFSWNPNQYNNGKCDLFDKADVVLFDLFKQLTKESTNTTELTPARRNMLQKGCVKKYSKNLSWLLHFHSMNNILSAIKYPNKKGTIKSNIDWNTVRLNPTEYLIDAPDNFFNNLYENYWNCFSKNLKGNFFQFEEKINEFTKKICLSG